MTTEQIRASKQEHDSLILWLRELVNFSTPSRVVVYRCSGWYWNVDTGKVWQIKGRKP